ncbi:MAG: hypothetical protein C4555_04180 [Dehalococcoidia bacterium]|nr:MAG: hypothetical protein C4555_04180 [Dehalococcoidia bacterium]
MKAIGTGSERRDIAVIGYFGQGNFGDDLLSSYILELIHQTVSLDRVVVSAPEGSYLERWFPGIRCQPAEQILCPSNNDLKKVIFGGGGQFFSFPPVNFRNLWGFLYCPAFRYWRMLGSLGWKRMNTYAFCIGVGPLEGFGARWVTRELFSHFNEISVRDDVSKEILNKLKINNVRVATDPSIRLANTFCQANRHNLKTVGIVFRRWPRVPDISGLIDELLAAAKILHSKGWQVEFISLQSKYDLEATRKIESHGEHVRSWEAETGFIPEFCRYLTSFSVLASMRAHGVILGLLSGVPTISLRIAPKLEITAAKFGNPNNVIPLESNAEEIASSIEQVKASHSDECEWQTEFRALEIESQRLRDWIKPDCPIDSV